MILRVESVSKSFGSVRALDKVSFQVEPQENFCIIGESGCGKSTLAKIIIGLLRADEGSVHASRGDIQMVFQDPYSSLDPLWTVGSILKEAFCRKRLSSAEKTDRIARILSAVGLTEDMTGRFPHEFSGGERQRIAIARALLAEPKVLLLDEAVSSLDVLVQAQIIDLLKRLKREFGLTYVFISHNLRVVKDFSDRIAVMHQGKIIETGTAAMIFDEPQQAYTRQLIRAAFDYQL